MNVKDHEEQQDMKISEEKEDDTACNIYHSKEGHMAYI